MSITDELREYVDGREGMGVSPLMRRTFTAIADRIDAEHERQLEVLYRDMSDAEYVKLPKDANGEYIHIGDLMAYADNTKPMVVVALVPPAVFLTKEGPRYADMCRHYHAPTVEDVLRELEGMRGNGATYEDVVTRCDELAKTLRGLLAVRTNERSS